MADWDDATVDWYAETHGEDRSITALIDTVTFAGTEDVLDIGCGTGSGLCAMAIRTQGALVGVDPFPRMIAHAKTTAADAGLSARIRFVTATAEALGLPDQSFDLVFAINAIHHWADIPAGLAEAWRVMRPGGRLVIGGERFDGMSLGHQQDYSAALGAAGFLAMVKPDHPALFVQTAERPSS